MNLLPEEVSVISCYDMRTIQSAQHCLQKARKQSAIYLLGRLHCKQFMGKSRNAKQGFKRMEKGARGLDVYRSAPDRNRLYRLIV